MLWILMIGALIAFIFTCAFTLSKSHPQQKKVVNWTFVGKYYLSLFICIVILVLSILGVVKIYNLSYTEREQIDKYMLLSLRSDNKDFYSFYYTTEDDDGIKKGNVDAKAATIYVDNENAPCILVIKSYKKDGVNSTLKSFLTFNLDILFSGSSEEISYEIYIPKITLEKLFCDSL